MTITSCAQQPAFLKLSEPATAERGERCEVTQLPVMGRQLVAGVGDGWFYDDFTEERAVQCRKSEPQRVSFTPTAKPPSGVVVKLECLDETQRYPNFRDDLLAGRTQPEIGTPCGLDTASVSGVGEETCELTLRDGSADHSLFCHPEHNVCVRACTSTTDCPPAWECDTRPKTLEHSGGRGAFCVNPTCGAETAASN